MAKLIKKDKWSQIFGGAILAIAGIVTVILSIVDKGSLDKVFSIIVAVSLFILGGILIVTNLIKSTYNFLDSGYLTGAIAIAFGVALCINTSLLPGILVHVIAITVLTFGVAVCTKAVVFCVKKAPTKYIVLAFVIGGLLLAAGILGLIFHAETKGFIYIIAGVALIVFGAINLINGLSK